MWCLAVWRSVSAAGATLGRPLHLYFTITDSDTCEKAMWVLLAGVEGLGSGVQGAGCRV